MTATYPQPGGGGAGGPETDPVAQPALAAHIADEPAHGADLAGTPRPPTTHAEAHGSAGGDPVSPTAIGAVSVTISDAKGDLLVGSGPDSFTRQAVGADGEVLTADAAQPLGVKWAAPESAGARVVTVADLGAAYTLALDGDPDVMLVGTLTQNSTLSITGATAAGKYTISVTASGATRTLTLPGGSTVTVPAGTRKTITGYSPDGTALLFFELGAAAAASASIPHPNGVLYETYPMLWVGGDAGQVMTNGRILLAAVAETLKAGVPITGIRAVTSTGHTTPTNQWGCLVRQSDRTVLAVTNDDTTTPWAAQAGKTLTFATPYTPSADEKIHAGVMVAATTMGNLRGVPGASQLSNAYSPLASVLSVETGLTTPVTPGTTLAAYAATTLAAIPHLALMG